MIETILGKLNWIDTVAGGVWTLLTVLMIIVMVRINRLKGWKNPYMFGMILLLVMVYLYPFYTSYYSNLVAGEIGNIFTLLLTLGVMLKIRDVSVPVSRILIPQIVWLGVASVYVGLQLIH